MAEPNSILFSDLSFIKVLRLREIIQNIPTSNNRGRCFKSRWRGGGMKIGPIWAQQISLRPYEESRRKILEILKKQLASSSRVASFWIWHFKCRHLAFMKLTPGLWKRMVKKGLQKYVIVLPFVPCLLTFVFVSLLLFHFSFCSFLLFSKKRKLN